jgi:hypothetical protein
MKLPSWLRLHRHPRVECPECASHTADDQCPTCGYELVRRSKEVTMPGSVLH